MRINFFGRRMPLLIITLSVLVTAGRSLAGDVSDGKATAVPPIVQAPEESWIHGDIGEEFSNQYIDRGFIYESTLKLLGAAGFYSGDFVAPKMNGLSFLSAGVGADYALPFIPKKMGKWWLVGNINYYYLGAGSYLVNVPQIRAARRNELVYQGGFRLDF